MVLWILRVKLDLLGWGMFGRFHNAPIPLNSSQKAIMRAQSCHTLQLQKRRQ